MVWGGTDWKPKNGTNVQNLCASLSKINITNKKFYYEDYIFNEKQNINSLSYCAKLRSNNSHLRANELIVSYFTDCIPALGIDTKRRLEV